MTVRPLQPIVRYLRSITLRQDGAGMTDGQLLEAFVTKHDANAFEAIVHRHGPMVFGVCHRRLSNQQDVEDAFQATFLVLVQKAASVSPRELVGNWLYGVANTTALRAISQSAKRRALEMQVTEMPEPVAEAKGPSTELRVVLDEELTGLPDKFRAPIVLCDLESRTRKEVARQLGIREGTLSSRLTTGRRMLASRVAKRGLSFSCIGLAPAHTQLGGLATIPPAFLKRTVAVALSNVMGQAATTSLVSTNVSDLANGVVKSMCLANLKAKFMSILILAVVALGGDLLYQRLAAAQEDKPETTTQSASKAEKTPTTLQPAKATITAERIIGEWKEVVSLKKPDDTLLVMTFRKSGICRLDALDRASQKQVQGPDVHLPGVGLWKIDGPNLVITWENWNQGKQQPVAVVERYEIEKSTFRELFYRATYPGRPREDFPLAKWTRFEGWWLATSPWLKQKN